MCLLEGLGDIICASPFPRMAIEVDVCRDENGKRVRFAVKCQTSSNDHLHSPVIVSEKERCASIQAQAEDLVVSALTPYKYLLHLHPGHGTLHLHGWRGKMMPLTRILGWDLLLPMGCVNMR